MLSPRRLILATVFLLSIAAFAAGVSIFLQPGQTILGILLITTAALVSSATVISGINDSYELFTKLGIGRKKPQNVHEDIYVHRRITVEGPDEPEEPKEVSVETELYRNLLDRASLTDLKDLCYLMGVDYDNYLGRKDDFVREWLQDMERQNRLAEMISLIRKEKSWILRSN